MFSGDLHVLRESLPDSVDRWGCPKSPGTEGAGDGTANSCCEASVVSAGLGYFRQLAPIWQHLDSAL